MSFVFIQSYVSLPSLGRVCNKVKVCHEIQFFTPEYTRACAALHNFCLSYSFKLFTISNFKQLNNESFYRILPLLSGEISLNPGHKNSLQQFDSNEWIFFKIKRTLPNSSKYQQPSSKNC